MRCPSCGAEVAALKFCENCGSPLPVADDATLPVQQQEDMTSASPHAQQEGYAPQQTESENAGFSAQQSGQMPQPAEPASPYAPEMPNDSAWEAQPQQAYQMGQTMQMPSQENAGGYIPPVGAPQAPYQQSAPYQAPSGNQAPNAAFVLVIVGLVLSVLFVTFVPGVICSIIGLVLNAGYNKKGLDNPRKTPTMVIGIIGIAVAVMCLVITVITGVFTARMINEMDRQGIDLATDSVEVTADSSGNVNISVKDSSTSASSSATASSASAASSGSSSLSVYEQDVYHDSQWNPKLYSLVELTGSELADMLEYYNYAWDDDFNGWYASDGSLYLVSKASGDLTEAQCRALPKGAAGEPVVLALWAEGYKTPAAAFKELSKDIVVEEMYDYGDTYIAVVYGSPLVRYLTVVTEGNENEQMFLLFTDEAISTGFFKDLMGVDAGSSINEVWDNIMLDTSLGESLD